MLPLLGPVLAVLPQSTFYIDGIRRAYSASGATGSVAYENGRDNGGFENDPFIVLGAEKHDYGPQYPSYSGFMDEMRISNIVRYTGTSFTAPTAPFKPDSNTMGLYHFDEGTGTILRDTSGATNGPSNGTLNVGGNPSGPVWSTDTPFGVAPSNTPTNTPTPTPTAAPYPNGTKYRVPITIDNSAGTAQTNFQVLVTLDTSALIASSKMQSDCDDIRFQDSDQSTALDYWIETGNSNGCNTTNTRIWVKVPSIPSATSKTIYAYYGNADLPAGSSGENTFVFFDDFNSFSNATWSSTNGTSGYSISGGTITITSGAVYTNAVIGNQPNQIAEAQVAWMNTDNGQAGLHIANTQTTSASNGTSAALAYFLKSLSTSDIYGLAATGTTASYDIATGSNMLGTISTGTKYIIGTAVTSSNVYFYQNRTELPGSEAPHTPGWSGNYYLWLGYFRGASSGTQDIADLAVDWVLVRKFATTEPTQSIGSESAAAIPDQVTGVSATAGDAQVSLAWTAPDNNGFPITDYVVQYRAGSSGSFITFADGTSASTTATITGLTNGQSYQFRVAATNSQGTGTFSSIVSATPVSGTAQAPVASAVSITGTAAIGNLLTGTYTYIDANGDVESGSTFRWLKSATLDGIYIPISGATSSSYIVGPSDLNQFLKFEVTPRTAIAPTTGSPVLSAGVQVADAYFHVLLTGQSYTKGYDGNPALTISQPYNNVKLNAGLTAFVPLIEDANPTDDNVNAVVESPQSAMGNTITNLVGNSRRMVISTNGIPGATYAQLRKGGSTSAYQDGLNQITAAKNIAIGGGYGYTVQAVALMHGPANFANGLAYEDILNEWQQDYEDDIKAITGQTGSIPMFIDQSSNFTAYNLATAPLVIAQYNAAKNNPDIYMVGPKYQLTYAVDNIHLPNTGYRWWGEYFGKAIAHVANGETVTALMPAQVVRNGNVISARFDVPKGPIVFDTINVPAQTNKGFEYTDDSSSASISSVAIDGTDTVRITLNTVPTGANPKLRYAYTGVPGGRPGADSTNGARGNLRDSDDTVSLYGNNLYNWAVHFEEAITTDETAPVISSVNYTPSTTSISATWTSGEPGSSQINYGLTSVDTSNTETNLAPRVTSHTSTVSGLMPCTTYLMRVRTEDLAQNVGTSSNAEVTTTGCTGTASVLAFKTKTVDPATGGAFNLLSNGYGLTLIVPQNYSTNQAQFQIHQLKASEVLDDTSSPVGTTLIGSYIYSLSAPISISSALTNFDEKLTISINYSDNDASGKVESSFAIYRWNGSSWNKLNDCAVNTTSNNVSCTTTQFSTFGLFGENVAATTPTPAPTTTTPHPTDTHSGGSSAISKTNTPQPCYDQSPGAKAPWIYSAVPESPTSIRLYFTEADGPLDRYILVFGKNTGDYIYGANSIGGIGSRSYLVKSLQANTRYYFKIQAGNGCSTGPWSNEISATTVSGFTFRNLQSLDISVTNDNKKQIITTNPELEDTEDVEYSTPDELQNEMKYTVTVKIVDPKKNPLANIEVRLKKLNKAGKTDSKGIVTFQDLTPGDDELLIQDGNYTGKQSISISGNSKTIHYTITATKQLNWALIIPIALGTLTLIFVVFRIKKGSVYYTDKFKSYNSLSQYKKNT
jgi:hypothetical protein